MENNNIELNEYAKEFFLYAYFGIVAKDYNDTIRKDSRTEMIGKCVRRAYLDMNRTLELNKEESPFYNLIGKELAEKLSCDKPVKELREDAYSVFFDGDDNVKASVGKLLKIKTVKGEKRKGKPFYYGQAQKWINMSIKYMWLIGLINDESELEPPIDSFIMKGASDFVEFPLYPDGEKKGKYSEGKTMPWSKLSKDETKDIQKGISDGIKNPPYDAPIKWECDTWIIQVETEKRKRKK